MAHRGGGSGGDGEDGSGPLSGTFFGGDDGAVYGGFLALQLICSITPNPSSQMLSAISSLFANRRPGSTIFYGDTGAVIHGVSSADCVYNRRQPRPWERYLMLGDGKCMPVGFYGDSNLDLHCEQDVRVTLMNVAVVPGLAFDIMSFNRMQERHEIILNGARASMLGGRVRLKKFRAGNCIQATRVPYDDASPQPPAMVAAMMRPGPPSSMNVNDFHNSLGHANVKALYETAKQMGIKLTGIQEYCDGCAAAKAIKRTVPKVVKSSRRSSRPFQRIFMDLAGGYPKYTGGANYLMQFLDDYTNFGWTVFLGDKSGPTVVRAFRTWYASVKQLMGVYGEVTCVLKDNCTEWVNDDFQTMLVDLGIAREMTAGDGPKSNGRVERRITLVSGRGKAAFVEFPNQFHDITVSPRTKVYAAISLETFTCMNDCLNITAAVHKDNKRCPEKKLYGKRRVKQAWPFMMPGFHHRNRPTKMHDKGERCFYLTSGNDHSSDTHKVISLAGIATYSAHCTFGYRRTAFQGEVPTWAGGVLLPLRGRGRLRRVLRERHRIRWQQRHLYAAGVFPPGHRRRQQLRVGEAFLPCLHREWRRRHLGYIRAGRVHFPRFHRHGHRRRRQLHVGGAFLPCLHLERQLRRRLRRYLPVAGVFPPRFQRRLLRRLRRHLPAVGVCPPRFRRRRLQVAHM